VAGAVENETIPNRRRILVACHRDSAVHEQVRSLLSAHPDWQTFTICEGFRQLPMMTRLYAPTHLVVETTWSGALWDQLRVLQRMPEASAMAVVGLLDPARTPAGDSDQGEEALKAALAERGITRLLSSAFELEHDLDEAPTAGSAAAAAASVAAPAPF
jgi:hypothetical protein